jgi:hypothetical protein
VTQQFLRGFLHLCDGLSFYVGHDEGIVVYLRGRFLLDHFQKRCGRQLAELRIDGPQNRMLAHDDLIGGESPCQR